MAAVGASFSFPHLPTKVSSWNAERPLSVGGANWPSCPTAAICVRSRSASSMPPRKGRGAGPSVRILHRVIACEAGRLSVHCRRDTIALFRVKAGGLDDEHRQRDPTTAASSTSFSAIYTASARRIKRPEADFASGLGDGVLREDLLDPLERLFRRRLRRHAILDIDPTGAPDMLVLDLGIGRVVGPELRQCRTEQTLRRVSRSVRVVEPPMIALYDRGHTRNVAAKARLQPLVRDFGLNDIFHKVLGDLDVLCSLWDQDAGVIGHAGHRLAVVAER